MVRTSKWLMVLAILAAGGTRVLAVAPEHPDFEHDVQPILSDNCYACHGPDESNREGGFRLDQKSSAIAEADSGTPPIVPGDAESSEVFVRLITDDEDLRMPPTDSGKQMTKEQIQLIRQWIEQGAAWQEHWAFVPPRQGQLPNVQDKDWLKTPVDLFVLGRLQSEGLKPSPRADRTTLIRIRAGIMVTDFRISSPARPAHELCPATLTTLLHDSRECGFIPSSRRPSISIKHHSEP